MSLWQPVSVAREELYYLEFLYAATASKTLEALNRHLATTSYELNELCTLTVIKFLQDFKEPANDRGLSWIVLVHCVFFQVHDFI